MRGQNPDYDAARSFLSLIYPGDGAQKLVNAMRKAKQVEYVAKDLLRASGLPLLPRGEAHVEDDLEKLSRERALVVADGYHRICAICHYDEDVSVRCRIVKARLRCT